MSEQPAETDLTEWMARVEAAGKALAILDGVAWHGGSAASRRVYKGQAKAALYASDTAGALEGPKALRAAASYFAAINVRMSPGDVEYVVDFLNTYAEQLEAE